MPTITIALMIALTSLRAGPVKPADPALPLERFTVTSAGGPSAKISGWLLPAKNTRGTLFMCHGFGQSKEIFIPYNWIREKENWNIVSFDFREHGESTNAWRQVRTLGYHEIWDVKAVIDWADSRGVAKPYAIVGVSMGGSIALRWAGADHRISGVLAESSYANGWEAVQKFPARGLPAGSARYLLRGGLRQMLQQVDIPTAVANRDDLIIWLTCGERDWFGKDDQQKILSASHSPKDLKKLFILQGRGHAQNWKDPATNDATIKSFLQACRDK